jgi:hypothetical protein
VDRQVRSADTRAGLEAVLRATAALRQLAPLSFPWSGKQVPAAPYPVGESCLPVLPHQRLPASAVPAVCLCVCSCVFCVSAGHPVGPGQTGPRFGGGPREQALCAGGCCAVMLSAKATQLVCVRPLCALRTFVLLLFRTGVAALVRHVVVWLMASDSTAVCVAAPTVADDDRTIHGA